MVNIGKILKRSWQILWNYRVLWIFAILLVLFGGGASGPSFNYRFSGNNNLSTNNILPESNSEWLNQFNQFFENNLDPLVVHPERYVTTLIIIGVVFLLIILLIGALSNLVRYPSETAVIRMVDEHEQTGSKLKFRQGWKLGWNRRAFRVWLIDLLLTIPKLVLVLLIIGFGLLIIFNIFPAFQATRWFGIIALIGSIFISVLLLVGVGVLLNLLRNFFVRAAAIDGLGVMDSIKQGWAIFKRNWKSAGLMWLVMVGIGIAYGIASIIVFFLLIPAYLVLLLPAAIVAFIPGAIAFAITSIFAGQVVTWIVAALIAFPFFFAVLFSPLILVGGWFNLYSLNIWTLTYREIKSMEALKVVDAPVENEQNPE